MSEFLPMSSNQAHMLDEMLLNEREDYLIHFTAFNTKGEIHRQSQAAIKDKFYSITYKKKLAGFYCLRGIDSGFVKPSFGVYINSAYRGKGLGRSAILHAIKYCSSQGFEIVMLKVDRNNHAALKLYIDIGFIPVGICDVTGHTIMEKDST